MRWELGLVAHGVPSNLQILWFLAWLVIFYWMLNLHLVLFKYF